MSAYFREVLIFLSALGVCSFLRGGVGGLCFIGGGMQGSTAGGRGGRQIIDNPTTSKKKAVIEYLNTRQNYRKINEIEVEGLFGNKQSSRQKNGMDTESLPLAIFEPMVVGLTASFFARRLSRSVWTCNSTIHDIYQHSKLLIKVPHFTQTNTF